MLAPLLFAAAALIVLPLLPVIDGWRTERRRGRGNLILPAERHAHSSGAVPGA